LKFDLAGIDETRRKLFGTLYNTYSFFSLYANIDGFEYKEEDVPMADRPEIDRWIISLLNSLIEKVDEYYADYEPTKAGRAIQEFVESNLSNWYVRLCRRRFWKGDYTTDKIAAYQTLYTCLEAISKMMAPIAPFFTDWMFQNLNNATGKSEKISVHLADFPVADKSQIDSDLEVRMDYAQRISSLVLSLRKKENLRVRQPLQKILLPILDDNYKNHVTQVEDLILHEVNVKEIEYLAEDSGVINKKIKPNFKTLGRKLGPHMKAAAAHIGGLDQDAIAAIEKTGVYKLELEDASFELTLEDFEINAAEIPGWTVAQDKEITLALDITLTDELKAEGLGRELVNRIQNIRKNSGFNVTDKIVVNITKHEALAKSLSDYADYIKAEVLATDIQQQDAYASGEEVDLGEDIKVFIGLDKA